MRLSEIKLRSVWLLIWSASFFVGMQMRAGEAVAELGLDVVAEASETVAEAGLEGLIAEIGQTAVDQLMAALDSLSASVAKFGEETAQVIETNVENVTNVLRRVGTKALGLLRRIGTKIVESGKEFVTHTGKDLVIQTVIMQGGQFAGEIFTTAGAAEYTQLLNEQSQLAQDFSTFQSQSAQAQGNAISNLTNQFVAQVNAIQAKQGGVQQVYTSAINYLNEAVNLNAPLADYLGSPVSWDQMFEHAQMYTPAGPVWYDLQRYGDWEFDGQLNCFTQYSLSAFNTLQNLIDNGLNNAIFTEYITPEKSYTIEVHCTLVRAQAPFMMGITFNKARWLSGDSERYWQSRLVGLFSPAAGDVALSFAETIVKEGATAGAITQSEATAAVQANNAVTTVDPLKRIADAKQTYGPSVIRHLTAQEVAAIAKGSVTYIFKIVTQPDDALIKVWLAGTPEPAGTGTSMKQLFGVPLSTYVFLYGGIGFIAPGCVARFEIKQPTTLVYTPVQAQNFQNSMKQLLAGKHTMLLS